MQVKDIDLSSDSVRRIISTHIFLILTIIFMTISTMNSIPADVWAKMGSSVISMGTAALFLANMSLFSQLRSWFLLKHIAELKESIHKSELEETDEEKER